MLKGIPQDLVDAESSWRKSNAALKTDAFVRFAQHARRDPSTASGIRVTVHSCNNLAVTSRERSRAYVHYIFPGYPQPIDTALRKGHRPIFQEKRVFEFGPDAQTSHVFASKLRDAFVDFSVFDAAVDGDEAHIGSTQVALKCVSPLLHV
jgi:hypothetical protein